MCKVTSHSPYQQKVNRDWKQMESKTQEEASIIKVSSLHCIDLANSDLRQLAVSLKQACPICVFFLLSQLWLQCDHYNFWKNIDTLWLIFVPGMSRLWVFLCYKSRYKRGVEGRGFQAEQKNICSSFRREDETIKKRKVSRLCTAPWSTLRSWQSSSGFVV